MRRLIAVILFLTANAFSFGQSPQTFDSVYSQVIATYGGAALDVTNARLTGTITYPGQAAAPFTLTLQQRSMRLDVQRPVELFTAIREDRRGQAVHGSQRDFPDQLPLYSSAFNIAPIFALLHFKTDARFTRSLVTAPDGSLGLQLVDGVPPGAKEPPFTQPKTTITFWLDSVYQIQSITFKSDRNPALSVTYKFTYPGLSSPFLQPASVVYFFGDRVMWTAIITATSVNVAVPADFFAIQGRN
jgi:hypothetical protein